MVVNWCDSNKAAFSCIDANVHASKSGESPMSQVPYLMWRVRGEIGAGELGCVDLESQKVMGQWLCSIKEFRKDQQLRNGLS